MKRKKLGFMNVKYELLTRSDMKQIVAGSGDYCGNIYCDVGGSQIWMGSGCNPDDPYGPILDAYANCELEAGMQSAQTGSDVTCNGCAQFP